MIDFRVNSEMLAGALALASGVADRKSQVPILANVVLRTDGPQALFIGATDLTVSFAATLSAEIRHNGGVTVGARQLFEIVRALPATELDVRTAEAHLLEIRSGRSYFKLLGLSDQSAPKLPDHREVAFSAVDGAAFRDMIGKTLFSVSTDETRYHLSGVLFESDGTRLRMVSTDGHRLSMAERTMACPKLAQSHIVPRKGLIEINRALETLEGQSELGFAQGHLFVRIGAVCLAAKVIDAQFPPYEQVVPKENARWLDLDRVALLDALNRIKLLSSEKTRGIRLRLEPHLLELSSDNPDLGLAKEELEVAYDGAPMQIGFNARYLIDVLTHIDDKVVELGLNGELDPCVLRPKDRTDYLSVVMPVRR